MMSTRELHGTDCLIDTDTYSTLIPGSTFSRFGRREKEGMFFTAGESKDILDLSLKVLEVEVELTKEYSQDALDDVAAPLY